MHFRHASRIYCLTYRGKDFIYLGIELNMYRMCVEISPDLVISLFPLYSKTATNLDIVVEKLSAEKS